MEQKRKKDTKYIFADVLLPEIVFVIGVILFIVVYGVKILNPFYVDWLLGLGASCIL